MNFLTFRKAKRSAWLATCASAAISAHSACGQTIPPQNPAAPQDAATSSTSTNPPATSAVSEVVVTGARRAQREAVADKRKTFLIQDIVTQDDIGRLPDTTVVEAARRIPGVSIDLLTDNTRGRTEVQRASIRGFDAKYNLVTIDGSEIASIDPTALSSGAVTRAFNLNLLPASLVSAIQVAKTIPAEDDPQALGGQINLVTRSAFTSRDPLYADFTVFGGLDTSSGDSTSAREPSTRASAIVSDRFDLPNLSGSRLGLTLAADYQDTYSSSNGVSIGVPGAANQNTAGWTYYGANGLSVAGPAQSPYGAVPTHFQVYSFDDELKHYSLSGKVEFAGGAHFRSTLFAGYFASESTETRNENLITRAPASQISGTGVAGTGAPTNLTATSGFYSIEDGEIGETYQPLRQNTDVINWKNQYRFSDTLVGDLDVAYSQAGGHLYRDMIKYVGAATASAASGSVSPISTSALAQSYNTSQFVPTIAFSNPANWSNAAAFVGDYWRSIHFDESDRVFEVHPSLAWNFEPDAMGFGGKVGGQLTDNTINYAEHYTEYDPKVPSNFLLSNDTFATGVTIPSWGGVPLGVVDRLKGNAILAANLSSFAAINESANNNANSFGFKEQAIAGYAEGVFNAPNYRIEAGLRYEQTHNDISSLEQVSNNVYAPIVDHSTYDSLLPSVIAEYRFTPDLIGHVAVTKTLGRPDPSAYGPLAKVGQPAAGNIAITLGNPDIKPRETTNYDASLDYYFDRRNSLLSLQYFHKDLKNEFYNKLSSAPYVYNGATYVGSFTQVENGASASVNGIELNFVKDRLPYIPPELGSVGFNANFTRMWTDFTILDGNGNPRTLPNLVNQPTYIVNASLFYTYDKAQLALSFNRQGKTLFQTGFYAWEDTYVLARSQLDLTARYQITPRLTLLFEGANLTGEPFRSAMGPGQTLAADDYKIGTQLWAGLNFKY